MHLILNAVFCFAILRFCEAGYGTRGDVEQEEQSDVQAPAYVPSYLKNQQFSKTYRSGTKTGFAGTKTGYAGTKTGYAGTKTGYGGTKTGYSGTKTVYTGTKTVPGGSKYSETKTWYSNSGSAPTYNEFLKNANKPFEAQCEPDCKNNGICVDTNTCHCAANFHGKYCEFEKKPCLTYPPMPMNSQRKCSSEMCTITCMEGHKFPDGTSVANMHCSEGQWQPTRADFSSIPDCAPECSPPCLNGGVCLSLNTCQCPQDYRGLQCQYSASACDIRKLAFNGAYNCFGDGDKFSCKLTCPSGSFFSSPTEGLFTCLYSTGIFEPQPIPHCVFDEVVIITPSNHHYSQSYNEVNIYNLTSESHSKTHYSLDQNGLNHQSMNHHGSGKPVIVVQDFTPKGGSCFTWAGVHYKTFDGKIYSFQSPCEHILVRDAIDHKYTVALKQGDCVTKSYCPAELTIYLEDKPYMLSVGEDGSVIFRNTRRLIPVPASLPGLRVAMPGSAVLVHLDAMGITVHWDTNNLVLIEGTVQLWNKTEGLCGTLDGNPENDFSTKDGSIAKTKSVMAAAWQIHKIGDICDSVPSESSACASKSNADMKRALQFCTKIFSKEKFRKCSKVMDVSRLLEACQWDYCACSVTQSPEECACSTVAVYAKECLRHGVEELRNWRDEHTCPMRCPEGKFYRSCGPDIQPSCAFPTVLPTDNSTCVEGCFCPSGYLLEGGKCVEKSQCPCRLRNKSFPPGSVVPKDCNTCSCEAGEWHCTQVPCGARCGVIGDPHYITFDGMRYDFMGHCTYYLLQTDNFTIEVENVACAYPKEMLLTHYKDEGEPSCTKSVNLNYNGAAIHMKQGGLMLVNGKEVSTLPVNVGDVKIRAASSLFIIVQMPNKVDIWWDGNNRLFVDVPPEFHDKTKGLCGTFNLNQKDDFLTPEGDIEQSAHAFANKWKTREFCADLDLEEPEHPCKVNVENKETAERYCSKLKSKLFEPCHWHIDVTPYYESCLYDMCACAGDAAGCLCPLLGDYAMACAKSGVHIQWRYSVKECELPCKNGQEYTVCADSCLQTCSDVAMLSVGSAGSVGSVGSAGSGECKPSCVEGCACPPGQVLDKNSVCVPVGLCPCYHKGIQFDSGYKEVRPGRRERELCTCVGARWACLPATPADIQGYPPAEDVRGNCSAARHMEFTACQLAQPLTCKNMHLPPSASSSECRPGCQCVKDYVLDVTSQRCVKPTECPCHHGGQSYQDGAVMKEDCNTCECKQGNWSCSSRKCAGVCTAWGDSHVITFDGTEYDFEGVCTYLLAKGVMDTKDGFDVEIQNVPCGTTGATCSKSLTLKVGTGNDEEIVSLTKNAPIPDTSKLKRIKKRIAGSFVFLDVPSLGMSVQWDQGMRAYIKVDSMWRNRLRGLCGNYNSDSRDDYTTPSGGDVAETSPLVFADSWKLRPTCPTPQPATDHCIQRPERKDWALSTCGLLKRHPFSLCHTEVSPSSFVDRCARDACACDSGADCECACTALAAYAHACAMRGVNFKWRTKELCPMQCDEECSNYDNCISPCPLETCDNTLYYSEIKVLCESESCIEGCKPKNACAEGTVYTNSSFSECVPRSTCKPVCMTLAAGRQVLEGEILEEDACHTCRCSKKQRICSGQPCATEPVTISIPTTINLLDEPLKCVSGWTQWISRMTPDTDDNGYSFDREPLPKAKEFQIGSAMCSAAKMSSIECRTVSGHRSPKETGLDVECSLEKGLVCREKGNVCADFEIRVKCDCGEEPFQCLNSTQPSHKHPTDCAKFYECLPDVGNPQKPHEVLKECSPGLMYNPVTMVCDWPNAVREIRPECGGKPKKLEESTTVLEETTTVTSTTAAQTTANPCKPNEVYLECAYPCDKLCDHFKKTFMDKEQCLPGQKCVSACVDQSVANTKCEFASKWRDAKTCVPVSDCTCYYEGQVVKPQKVIREGCTKCQCLDNDLHCDQSDCVSVEFPFQGSTHLPMLSPESFYHTEPHSTFFVNETDGTTPITTEKIVPTTLSTTKATTLTTEATTLTTKAATLTTKATTLPTTKVTTPTPVTTLPTTTNAPLIIKTTVTPPPECTLDRYKSLLWGEDELPESSFSASSVANALFEPQYAVLDGHPLDITAGSWNPSTNDKNQYIQVEFPNRTAVYGVKMQGSPLFEQFVTSYDVMYGDDGNTFHTVDGADGKPQVFRGPIEHNTAMTQLFSPPIEAKFVRIRPLTWHDEIAIRFELIGCSEPTVTTAGTTATTPETMQCTEPLGLAADLPVEQIEVSSNNAGRKNFLLSGEKGWKPAYSTPGEWIMFDFYSPRNITGIKTKGGPSGFVTAYSIMYTSDLSTFNPVTDSSGATRLFPGNFDADTVVQNEFRPPIHARYLKVLPIKWNKAIEARVEPIGCFEPYPVTEATTPVTTPEPMQCTEPLGLAADLPVEQIEVSSNNAGRKDFLLDGDRGWKPAYSTPGEWIMFDFYSPRNITGVKTKGGPSGFVTAYSIMYTSDLSTFNPVTDSSGATRVFNGNSDTDSVVFNEFHPPIRARYLKLLPVKWEKAIEARVEPIGCFEPYPLTEATTPFTTPFPPQCTEPLGLAASLPLEQIEVSSNNDGRSHFQLAGDQGWRPSYSAPGEWIMFDFYSPRNITGIKTKGGPSGFVTAYSIMYTSDLSTFNPVTDSSGATRVFNGNSDADSVVLNEFHPPIRARYLKVLPVKWEKAIEARVEPIGCFEPYPVTEIIPPPNVPTTSRPCEVCPGVVTSGCDCTPPNIYYDGENCVDRDQCPCVEGFMTYAVGSSFRGDKCDECVCKLGGIPDCKPAKKCVCAPDLVPKLTPSCECLCEPCPNGTKICPTSKLCLALDKWCNGLQDCPDDERNCEVPTTTPATTHIVIKTVEPLVVTTVAPTVAAKVTTPAPTTVAPQECPKVECPTGYMVYLTTSQPTSHAKTLADLPPPRRRNSYQRYQRGGYSKGGYAKGGYTKTSYSKTGFTKTGYAKGGFGPQTNQAFSLAKPSLPTSPTPLAPSPCVQFRCVAKLPPLRPGSTPPPLECAAPVCPPLYALKLQPSRDRCPQYNCVPPPARPAYCSLTGRTFNTFDGTEYKYDICFHILARENRFDAWTVLVRKKCRIEGCQNEVLVHQDDQLILVKPNLMIEYDNFEYTVEQTSKICFQKNSFDVARLGDGISIKSRKYNFTVVYNNGDVKVGVPKSTRGTIDGLCGLYDGDGRNDRQLPEGRLAHSIDEFGRAWAKPGLPVDACGTKVIPPDRQKRAWELCDVVTKEPLSQCEVVLKLDKWRSICLEKICECTEQIVNGTRRTEEECRCLFVEQMVAECLAENKDLDVSAWRLQMDCPANCPAPLVHYDCYRSRCEPACTNVGETVGCPKEDGQCFPGCYCPPGTLREGDQCVAPSDCLDCTCTGVGAPAKYVTFEGDDLPFMGNCTYLASRDRNETGQHKYEVYASNGPCEDKPAVVCTKAVHIIFEKNTIHITKDPVSKKLLTSFGEDAVFNYPVKKDWVSISLVNQRDINVVLPDVHVEISVLQSKLEFSIALPSFVYANRTEGLCGVCAGYQDQLVTSYGNTTDDVEEYGKSWKALPSTLSSLAIPPQPQCAPPPAPPPCRPPAGNQCKRLYGDAFRQCHVLIDPEPYLDSCESDLCDNITDVCRTLQRYASDCRKQGLCLEWRQDGCPIECEAPLVYRPCVDCVKTCENYEELEKNPKKCHKEPIEGCFCPEGKVRVNNTCIEPSKCFACYGDTIHYAGEEWQEDACTKCSCIKSPTEQRAHESCSKQSCAQPFCADSEDLVTARKPTQCCADYMCVPRPTENIVCEQPKKLDCGFGQVLKLKTKDNGCKEFTCECKPPSECEQIPSDSEVEMLEPGMQRTIDNSSCCPKAIIFCNKQLCPKKPECEEFKNLVVRNDTAKCCPEYSCELPKDKCLVTLEWEASPKGGEVPRSKPLKMLKDLDSTWLDGPCRSCSCLPAGAQCSPAQCAAILSTSQFVLEPRPEPFQCCAGVKYVACRDGDRIYKVGENWTSTEDVCESYQCVETDDGKLEKQTTKQTCDANCSPGWKYFPADPQSKQCCGKCKPVACVVDGTERNIGEKWTSKDYCSNYTCVDLNGTLQVQSSDESCPSIPDSLRKQFVLEEKLIPGKCCKTQEPVACRVGNKIYQEGQTWPTSDPCKNTTCARDSNGRLSHLDSLETCNTDCERGWSYQPASLECCGKCVQEACVVGDLLKTPGSTWYSPDNCTTYSCSRLDDVIVVTSSVKQCLDVSQCKQEYLKPTEDGCCQVCDEPAAALTTCIPESIPPHDTIGLIRSRAAPNRLCVNKEPLHKFTECRGHCNSGTVYNNQTGIHESSCQCCTATRFTSLEVTLTCEDGSTRRHRVAAPQACACAACGDSRPAKPGTKTVNSGVKNYQRVPRDEHEHADYDIPEIFKRLGEDS